MMQENGVSHARLQGNFTYPPSSPCSLASVLEEAHFVEALGHALR
jgi:hypothetical protein